MTETPASPVTSAGQSTSSGIGASLTLDNFPRVDGSTATIPLMELAMERITGASKDAVTAKLHEWNGQNTPDALVSTTSYAWLNITAEYQGENGQTAYNTDLLIVGAPDEQTRESVVASGMALDVAPVGLDGLVFLANKDNPVQGLTTDQIRAIYSGTTTNWKDVGGADQPIIAYQRPEASGSQALMRSLVMQGRGMTNAPLELRPGDMAGIFADILSYQNTANAIGYSVYYYATMMQNQPDIKLLDVDGVTPSKQSIGSGAYPFVNAFYAVIRHAEPEGSPARTVFNWLAGADGTQAVVDAGYVGIDPAAPAGRDPLAPGPSTPGCKTGIVIPAGVDAGLICSPEMPEVSEQYADKVVEPTNPSLDDYSETYAIKTPSGNIVCEMTMGGSTFHGTGLLPNIDCVIAKVDFPMSGVTEEGLDSNGIEFTLYDDGFPSGPDAPLKVENPDAHSPLDDAAQAQELPYGMIFGQNPIYCQSTEQFLTCWNFDSQHGFALSRQDYLLW